MKTLVMNLKFSALGVVLCCAACSNHSNSVSAVGNTADTTEKSKTITGLKPAGPAPEWGKTIHPEMQTVIEKLSSYGDKPIETLSATAARKNHTPTDAVMDLIKEHNISLPAPAVDTIGKEILAKGGNIHLRIYTPKVGKGPFPIIVYYHGGGFVIANIDVYNASAQALAEQAGAIVVAVAYRLAPEHKFPVAHEDSFAAYEWVVKNAATINGNPKKIAVAGESAGGNLAANVSIMARDKKIMLPLHEILVYPIAQADMTTKSYLTYAKAHPLNKPMMSWFTEKYVNKTAESKDPRISLVDANLKGLPPTTIITAEIDPLNNDGVMLADKLKAAGVQVESKNYPGVTHEFFGMAAVVPEAKDAQAYVAGQLKKTFGK
jgi:acetyl esterase